MIRAMSGNMTAQNRNWVVLPIQNDARIWESIPVAKPD